MSRLALLCLLVACGTPKEPTSTAPRGAGSQATAATPAAEAPDAEAPSGDRVTLAGETGPITITPVYHATLILQHGQTTVWFDPWSKGALAEHPKADVVVLTDIHFDHTDPEALAQVVTDKTVFVTPAAVDEKLADRGVQHVIANGESASVAGMQLTAVPMYNLVRGPEEGGVFHEKGRGNGYIVTVDGRRIYIAGDTECTEEMKALTDIDLAFVPMNLPYTMPPDEAAACVKAFAPARVVPFHYAGSDTAAFEQALSGTEGVTVERVEFYPGGQPW